MSENREQSTKAEKGSWVTWRPEIKVLDCSIRNGGLMNGWQFDKALVKDVFDGLA